MTLCDGMIVVGEGMDDSVGLISIVSLIHFEQTSVTVKL